MRVPAVWAVLGLLLQAGPGLAEGASTDAPGHDSEREAQNLSRPAQVQADPTKHLADFTTDGCSGGLSDGWATLSRTLPAFKAAFGDHPPYQSCCTTHDRTYWRGETVDGYARRLEADEALRRCVTDYGTRHRSEYAERFHLPEDTITKNFQVIGDLMYYAVRAGGGPCSSFPWRWGYGWPACP